MDRLMLMAFRKSEDEVSKNTGQPIWRARSLDNRVAFSVETMEDGAEKALQQFDKKQQESKSPKFGIARWVVATMVDDSPLLEGGLAREAFYREVGEYMKQVHDTVGDLDIERMPPGGYDPREYGDGLVESP